MRKILLPALAMVSAIGMTCCISYDQIKMRLVGEDAIIVWDQNTKTEHFIRSAVFDGRAETFGFILPVPYKPSALEVASERAFATLERLQPNRSRGKSASVGASGGGVEIIEQKRVGDYEATVLKATDASALSTWLQKYGHQMRPAMKPWFQHYMDRAWMFVAFKYMGQAGPTPTMAVRVSFPADRPHYPYKMPSDTFAKTEARKLRLFVVSQTPMRGKYASGGAWETQARWTAPLSPGVENQLTEQLGMRLPAKMTVTRFENSPTALNYGSDLTFEQGPEVDPTKRIGFNLSLPLELLAQSVVDLRS